MVEANNEIKRLTLEEKKEIERILKELSSEVSLVSKLLEMTYETVILLDIIFARANFAHKYDCYKPIINNQGKVNLIGAKHPLLDRQKAVAVASIAFKFIARTSEALTFSSFLALGSTLGSAV